MASPARGGHVLYRTFEVSVWRQHVSHENQHVRIPYTLAGRSVVPLASCFVWLVISAGLGHVSGVRTAHARVHGYGCA